MIPPPKPETVRYLGVQVGLGHDLRAPDLVLRLQDQGGSSKAMATTTTTGIIKDMPFSLLLICGTRHIKTQSNFTFKAFNCGKK